MHSGGGVVDTGGHYTVAGADDSILEGLALLKDSIPEDPSSSTSFSDEAARDMHSRITEAINVLANGLLPPGVWSEGTTGLDGKRIAWSVYEFAEPTKCLVSKQSDH